MNYTYESKIVQNSHQKNHNHILRLERNFRDLDLLHCKLNKYIYEPKTKDLFEQKSNLLQQLKRLKNKNRQIFTAIKDRKEVLESQIENIKIQFSEFLTLETEIKAYYTSAHNH
ncbi:hypothetical protein KO500_07910 [Cellulophaga baltica]|uniref:hypothetical protein n=1 Tax=Cellulophaga TaxID=104264 RepID=UPI001C06BCB2|nr:MULTISPECIES: hypothetical protein [Cellulophaga]MBU2996355.1 hypothetical protein [Cellulophaga baltica]MDO6767751.1 hypothetical protein [Cellulophaga sp. 1_MG-2023]